MAGKVQRTYETVIAYHPDRSEEEVEALGNRVREIINSHGGVAGPVRYWGKLRLAYRIRKQRYAHYTHVVYTANRDTILELERNLKIWDDVMRHLTVKISDKPLPEEELARLSREAIIPSSEDIMTSEVEELAEAGVYTPTRPAPAEAAPSAEQEKGKDDSKQKSEEPGKSEGAQGEKE